MVTRRRGKSVDPTVSPLRFRRPAAEPPPAQSGRRRWTEQLIVAELKRLGAAGVALTRAGLIAAGHSELAHAVNNFGGLSRVRRAADLPFVRREAAQSPPSADAVLAELRRRAATGEPLASSKVPARLEYAGRLRFGSWGAAIAAAGLDYDSIRQPRQLSDEALFERLRALAAARPEMTLSELKTQTIGSTLFRRFGSLEEAARRAGLDEWPRRRSRRGRPRRG